MTAAVKIAAAKGSRRSRAKSVGRPRDPAFEARLLDATVQLLARDGYARMSLDAVAELAGV